MGAWAVIPFRLDFSNIPPTDLIETISDR